MGVGAKGSQRALQLVFWLIVLVDEIYPIRRSIDDYIDAVDNGVSRIDK